MNGGGGGGGGEGEWMGMERPETLTDPEGTGLEKDED